MLNYKKLISIAVAATLTISAFTLFQPDHSSANNSIDNLSQNFRLNKLVVNGQEYVPQYDNNFDVVYFDDIAYETLVNKLVEADYIIQPLNNNKITSVDSSIAQGPAINFKSMDYSDQTHSVTFAVNENKETMVTIKTDVNYTDSKGNRQQESFNTEYYFYSDPSITPKQVQQSSQSTNQTTQTAQTDQNIELDLIHHATDPSNKGVLVKGAQKRVLVELFRDGDLIEVKQTDTLGAAYFKGLEDGSYTFVVDGEKLNFRVRNSSITSEDDQKENEDLIKEYTENMFEDLLENEDFVTTFKNMQDEKKFEKASNKITVENFKDKYSLLFSEYERTVGSRSRVSTNDLLFDIEYLDEKRSIEKKLEDKISDYKDNEAYQELFEDQLNLHLNFLSYSVDKIIFEDNLSSPGNNAISSSDNNDAYYEQLYYQLVAENLKGQAKQEQQSPAQPQSIPQNNVIKPVSLPPAPSSSTVPQPPKKQTISEVSAPKNAQQATTQSVSSEQKETLASNNGVSTKTTSNNVSEETKQKVKTLYEEYYRDLDDNMGDGFVDAMLGEHIKVEDLPKEKQELYNYYTNELEKRLKDETGLSLIEAQQILLLEDFALIGVKSDVQPKNINNNDSLVAKKVGVPKTGDGSANSIHLSSSLFTMMGIILAALSIFIYERIKSIS